MSDTSETDSLPPQWFTAYMNKLMSNATETLTKSVDTSLEEHDQYCPFKEKFMALQKSMDNLQAGLTDDIGIYIHSSLTPPQSPEMQKHDDESSSEELENCHHGGEEATSSQISTYLFEKIEEESNLECSTQQVQQNPISEFHNEENSEENTNLIETFLETSQHPNLNKIVEPTENVPDNVNEQCQEKDEVVDEKFETLRNTIELEKIQDEDFINIEAQNISQNMKPEQKDEIEYHLDDTIPVENLEEFSGSQESAVQFYENNEINVIETVESSIENSENRKSDVNSNVTIYLAKEMDKDTGIKMQLEDNHDNDYKNDNEEKVVAVPKDLENRMSLEFANIKDPIETINSDEEKLVNVNQNEEGNENDRLLIRMQMKKNRDEEYVDVFDGLENGNKNKKRKLDLNPEIPENKFFSKILMIEKGIEEEDPIVHEGLKEQHADIDKISVSEESENKILFAEMEMNKVDSSELRVTISDEFENELKKKEEKIDMSPEIFTAQILPETSIVKDAIANKISNEGNSLDETMRTEKINDSKNVKILTELVNENEKEGEKVDDPASTVDQIFPKTLKTENKIETDCSEDDTLKYEYVNDDLEEESSEKDSQEEHTKIRIKKIRYPEHEDVSDELVKGNQNKKRKIGLDLENETLIIDKEIITKELDTKTIHSEANLVGKNDLKEIDDRKLILKNNVDVIENEYETTSGKVDVIINDEEGTIGSDPELLANQISSEILIIENKNIEGEILTTAVQKNENHDLEQQFISSKTGDVKVSEEGKIDSVQENFTNQIPSELLITEARNEVAISEKTDNVEYEFGEEEDERLHSEVNIKNNIDSEHEKIFDSVENEKKNEGNIGTTSEFVDNEFPSDMIFEKKTENRSSKNDEVRVVSDSLVFKDEIKTKEECFNSTEVQNSSEELKIGDGEEKSDFDENKFENVSSVKYEEIIPVEIIQIVDGRNIPEITEIKEMGKEENHQSMPLGMKFEKREDVIGVNLNGCSNTLEKINLNMRKEEQFPRILESKILPRMILSPEMKIDRTFMNKLDYFLNRFIEDSDYSPISLNKEIDRMLTIKRTIGIEVVNLFFSKCRKSPIHSFCLVSALKHFSKIHSKQFDIRPIILEQCTEELTKRTLNDISAVKMIIFLFWRGLLDPCFIHRYVQYFFSRGDETAIENICELVVSFDWIEFRIKTDYYDRLKNIADQRNFHPSVISKIHCVLNEKRRFRKLST